MEKISMVLTAGSMGVFLLTIVTLLMFVALNVSGLYSAPEAVFNFLGLSVFWAMGAGIIILPFSLILQEMGE